jgi:hypothetical protein
VQDYATFLWQDGTNTRPNPTPSTLSQQSTLVGTYAHWGGGKSTGTTYEPASSTANCVVATTNVVALTTARYPLYHYYSATTSAVDRQTAANYVSTAGKNLRAWMKVRVQPAWYSVVQCDTSSSLADACTERSGKVLILLDNFTFCTFIAIGATCHMTVQSQCLLLPGAVHVAWSALMLYRLDSQLRVPWQLQLPLPYMCL